MAITKILNMKESTSGNRHKHLKNAINYICNDKKTSERRLVGSINCNANSAYEHMISTKKFWGKEDKRQAYHIILSFAPGETDPETALKIVHDFAEAYLGERFEVIYAVHDDKAHIHGHIIFNSVSYLDGYKYRYTKGDWANSIQPITNRLCDIYNLSIIDVNMPGKWRNVQRKDYMHEQKEETIRTSWHEQIRCDIDAAILQSSNYNEFLAMLEQAGYAIKIGKYLSIKPVGKKRFCRTYTLGEGYSVEDIEKRISDPAKYSATRSDKYHIQSIKLPQYIFEIPLIKSNISYKLRGENRKEQLILERKKKEIDYIYKHGIKTIEDVSKRMDELNTMTLMYRKEIKGVYDERDKHKEALHKLTDDQKKIYEELKSEGYNIDELKEFDEESVLKIRELYSQIKKANSEKKILKNIIFDSVAKVEKVDPKVEWKGRE